MQWGTLSESFRIGRGCGQRDPISAYLFIICAQIMFLLVHNDKNFIGPIISGKGHKIELFADDTTFMLDGSKRYLAALNTVFGFMFQIQSSLLFIYSLLFCKQSINTLNFSSLSFKILKHFTLSFWFYVWFQIEF